MQVQHAVLLPAHNSPPQTPAKPIYLGAGQCEGWKRSNLTLQRYSCQIAGFLFLLYFPHLLPAILYQQLSMSTCKTIQRVADYWKLWVKAERCEDSLAAARTLADCTSNGLHNVCQPPLCLLQCNRGGGSVPLQLNKAVGDTAQVGFLEVPLAVGALPPLLHHGARKAVSQRFQLQKPYLNLHPQSSQQLCGQISLWSKSCSSAWLSKEGARLMPVPCIARCLWQEGAGKRFISLVTLCIRLHWNHTWVLFSLTFLAPSHRGH